MKLKNKVPMYTPYEITALQQSMQELQQGRFEQARKQLKALRKRHPDNAEALHLLGLVSFQTGQAEEGLSQLKRAAELLPQAAHVRNNLANLLLSLNRVDEARAYYLEAIKLNPEQGDAYLNLGNTYRLDGQLAKALDAYQHAARLIPSHPGILLSLGVVQAAFGQLGPAEASYRQALSLDQNLYEAWFQLGELCLAQDRLDEAWTCFQHVIRLKPAHAPSLNSLGNIFFLKDQLAQAERFYQQALNLNPDFAEAANNMGFVCYLREAYAEAETWVRRALTIKPDYAQAWENLASVYRKLEDMPAAEAAYLRAAELSGRRELTVKSALMLPGLYESAAEMQAWRERFAQNLDTLLQNPVPLHDPSIAIGEVPFYLHCHSEPWLELAQKLGAFYRQACPMLDWTAPHCREPLKAPGERLKLGIVSSNLKNHSIGKMFGALTSLLARARFEVVICADAPPADALAERIAAAADGYLVLPEAFYSAREALAAERFDILLYPEIGNEPRPYFLAYARLAPLQAALWGVGSSSGLPEVDVYFSVQGFETEASRRCFSETLIECEHLLACFDWPDYPRQLKQRADFGLPEHGPVYGCLQSLFKLHPDFDQALRRLLEADSEATLVLLEGHYAAWTDKLKARLSRVLGPAFARVKFFARLSPADYLQLAGCCDVQLDPWPLSGGLSTYELLRTGVPLVTRTGLFNKNRLSHAILARLGVTETVTETPEAYIALAHALAHDSQARASLREKIFAGLDQLYDRREGIDEFSDLLYQAYFAVSDPANSDPAKTSPKVRDLGP